MTVAPDETVKTALSKMDVGSSVAEQDINLQRYFLETEPFRALVEDRCDIVAGDKGTGKTALFRSLQDRQRNYSELARVEIIPGFNPGGTPVFQRLQEIESLHEDSYIGVWKSYVLSLAGNYILDIVDEVEYTTDMRRLDGLLAATGLRTSDDAPSTVFSQLANRLKRLLFPKSVGASVIVPENGVPIWSVDFEFDKASDREDYLEVSRHDDALQLLDRIIGHWDISLWIAIDRLDEAFPSRPALERAALRGLFRTYLDMQDLKNIRLKLFVRRDLFSRVTEGGFVNLTHVNARRIDIEWDEQDLFQMLYERIHDQAAFVDEMGLKGLGAEETFARLFPDQVDPGGGKPKTWRWILTRIADGNGIAPPRNLIDLVTKSKEAQMRVEQRSPRRLDDSHPLILSDSLKRGLGALSALRVEDTLLAEAADLSPMIERFRNGKSEHNVASIAEAVGDSNPEIVKRLRNIGFLESVGSNYKIPMLYRSGLAVTQGKAFD